MYAAYAAGCEAIATSKARSAIAYRTLDLNLDLKDVPQHYREMAKMARKRAAHPTAEEIDSFDYRQGDFGEDESEYVGDIIT